MPHVRAQFAAGAAPRPRPPDTVVDDEVERQRNALKTRHLIGLAQGILMERDDLTEGQALCYLRRRSQETNIKLSEVAREVVCEQERTTRPR